MVEIRQEIDIKGTADAVFAGIVDFRAYERWLTSSSSFRGITDISSDPIELGTTWVEPGRGGVRRGTVTRFEPPTCVAFHQPMTMRPRVLGVIDISVVLTLSPTAGGVHVRRVVTVGVPRQLKIVQPLVIRQIRTESGRTLLALKACVEAAESHPGR